MTNDYEALAKNQIRRIVVNNARYEATVADTEARLHREYIERLQRTKTSRELTCFGFDPNGELKAAQNRRIDNIGDLFMIMEIFGSEFTSDAWHEAERALGLVSS